jgi:hypothetical protein
MYGNIKEHLQAEQTIEENGIFKERIITSPQGAETISTGETVLNFVLIII